MQPDETTDKMYADGDTIRKLHAEGALVPYSYLDELFRLTGMV